MCCVFVQGRHSRSGRGQEVVTGSCGITSHHSRLLQRYQTTLEGKSFTFTLTLVTYFVQPDYCPVNNYVWKSLIWSALWTTGYHFVKDLCIFLVDVICRRKNSCHVVYHYMRYKIVKIFNWTQYAVLVNVKKF